MTALLYLTFALFSSVAFWPVTSPVNGFFEAMSGVTFTGLSILKVEQLPQSLLFFRAWSQWVGGAGIVTPKLAAVTKMQALLAGSSEVDFSLLTQGGLRLVELQTGGVKRSLAELELPKGALLISIVREDKVILRQGNTKLEENDTLLFLVESDRVTRSLERALYL